MAIKILYLTIVVYCQIHKNKMSDIVSTILLIHVYIFVACALFDVDVASVQEVTSVQRHMPHGNGQVNWVSYSLLCKRIHVLILYTISINVGLYLLFTEV